MPFRSEAQRRFLWAKHPEIAKKWAHGEHSTKGKNASHKMPTSREGRREAYNNAIKRRLTKRRGR